jgi:PAS domain S-box-containing protein
VDRFVSLVVSGASAIIFAAGFGAAVVLFTKGSFGLTDTLLIVVIVSLALAAALHYTHTRQRIGDLQHELIDTRAYKLFVDHAIQGFFRATSDGKLIEANSALAAIYGYNTPDELRTELNKDPHRIYIDPTQRVQFSSQMLAQGSVNEFISKMRRRDGKAIWIVQNARAVYDTGGRFLFYEGTVQDITVQRESLQAMRRALQESQDAARSKAAFIAAMSHELRTPLNAVIGFTELMMQQLFGPISDRYHSYLGDIHSNGKKLLRLITDVLDFARIEGGALQLSEDVFALGEIIDAARATAVQDNSHAPPITVKLPKDLPLLRGDSKRILQVFVNLLSNAVKFTAADGSIKVRAYRGVDQGLLVEIVDTGIGIAPDQIAIALEPFKQIDGRLARRFEGLGLGLPLSQALMQLHNGRLAISSTPGEGTTVNLAFPPGRVLDTNLKYVHERKEGLAAE